MEDIFRQLYEEVSPTVVIVHQNRQFSDNGTGFILMSEKRYSLVLTSSNIIKSRHELFVSFGKDSSSPMIAQVLCSKENEQFMILIVKTDCQHKEIAFSTDPVKRQVIATIGAISTNRYLGTYKGLVLSPSCAAFDDWGQHLDGSEDYFLLKCTFQDKSVADTGEFHAANKLISAPIFSLNGTVVGIVASVTDSNDVKVGLHNKGIYNSLRRLCGGAEWKKLLKGFADNFCNEELSPKGKRKRESEDGTEGSHILFPKSQRYM